LDNNGRCAVELRAPLPALVQRAPPLDGRRDGAPRAVGGDARVQKGNFINYEDQLRQHDDDVVLHKGEC
jgi:hypothetical protein